MINSEIRAVLTDPRIGAPNYQFQAPEGASFPHTVTNYISDRGEFYVEGDESIQWSEVQVDIYQGSNYNAMLEAVLTVAKEHGFYKGNGWGRFDSARNVPYYTLRLLKENEDASN